MSGKEKWWSEWMHLPFDMVNKTSGLFEYDDDWYQLTLSSVVVDELEVRHVGGVHFFGGKSFPVYYSRGGSRGKNVYLQFVRPRLPGERRGKMIRVPISAIREVFFKEGDEV